VPPCNDCVHNYTVVKGKWYLVNLRCPEMPCMYAGSPDSIMLSNPSTDPLAQHEYIIITLYLLMKCTQ